MGKLNQDRDPMTGLWNAKYALKLLESILGHNGQVALIFIDIDRLHSFNDRFGHDEGDKKIKEIAREIEELSGKGALVFRYGGDEFGVILPEVSLEEAREIAESIRAKRQPVLLMRNEKTESTLTLSLGIAHFPTQTFDANSLIDAAYLALLKAKDGGRLPDGSRYIGRNRVMAIGDFMDEFPQESAKFLNEEVTSISASGFTVAYNRLNASQVEELRELVGNIEGDGVSKRENVFAIRNLLDVPKIQELARSLRYLVEPFLGENCFAVRGIFFDKTPDANWKVPFHQDLSIAVKEKIEVEGYGPWSQKAGAIHVQPPASVLEKMLTIRVHLDNCDENNGALRVVPGSHRLGKLDAEQIAREIEKESVSVAVPAGDAMLMHPLLLHASSPSRNANHRRVIHLEYAGVELPDGLDWLHRI